MKLSIDKRNSFKKKFQLLSDSEKKEVNEHVQKLITSFENGKSFFNKNVYQPYQFNLKNNLESSLYASKISQNLRLILSVDEDPIFNKLDVTLFDVTGKDKETSSFRKIGEHIYRLENLLQ